MAKIKTTFTAAFSTGTILTQTSSRPFAAAWLIECPTLEGGYVAGFSSRPDLAAKERDAWLARFRKSGVAVAKTEIVEAKVA